ncbi:tetratricopeptide (TPR) repeat protein [Hamadaea flava]|uniref:Tetratricopeptide repeat protein n=1 Tax=Hamadaea flava TaxID=1742688 RepID=A0ABV8LF98_9ACTN|nr:hypothetical protein [Hamadaea flava]MCP2323367.1 tetratricopeptide (TPR) repeat protein [Hamadaea flava]
MADNNPATDPPEIGLDAVQSLDAFARACDRLRAGRSYSDLSKAARPRPLPAATLSDLFNAKSTPTRDTVITFLTACDLDNEAQRPWLAAWERVATAHKPHPVGAVRVGAARPRLLGVHAAIQIPGTAKELPPYVPRDLDADLRGALTAAAGQGGFVLLIGGSSVGKTRALYEAVHAELREWWMLHPADTPAITAYAAVPTPRTVVWLDELQRYVNHADGLPVGIMQQLITAGSVVVATLWPDEHSMRTARPPAGRSDPYASDRDLLRLAHIIRVPDTLSPAERRRGDALAPNDQRIRIALSATDAGFTQVLAAGPALIQHWEQATDCYGKAVITAALDARRVGTHQPLTRAFLEESAQVYLTTAQRATAPENWLEQALAYASIKLHGAASCLTPVAAGMGRIGGWNSADYLHQHAQRVRRTEPLPDAVWQALVTHHHPNDNHWLAESARLRGLSAHAIALFRPLADAGDENASRYLAELLGDQNHVDELRDRAGAGDWYASNELARWVATHGDVEELRLRAEAGDVSARDQLDEVLALQGDVDQLRGRAHAGDPYACYLLVHHLAATGHEDEAISVLRAWSTVTPKLNSVLAGLLARRGEIDEAIALLRERAATGEPQANYVLPQMLADHGHLDESIAMLRARVDALGRFQSHFLAQVLVQHNRIDEAIDVLTNAAKHPNDLLKSDVFASEMLAQLLVEQGRLEQLRQQADLGDSCAATALAKYLVAEGRLDELRERSEAGDVAAADHLARHLAEPDIDTAVLQLRAQVDARVPGSATSLARLLADHGRVDEAIALLRDLVGSGGYVVAVCLINILAQHGRLGELREEQAAGTHDAALALRSLERGEPWPRRPRQPGEPVRKPALRLDFLFLDPP